MLSPDTFNFSREGKTLAMLPTLKSPLGPRFPLRWRRFTLGKFVALSPSRLFKRGVGLEGDLAVEVVGDGGTDGRREDGGEGIVGLG
jgi:hypothetical protein